MKRTLLFFLLYSIVLISYSQTTFDDTKKLATLCKIWGFLKYYHPEVTKGRYDWDKELLERLPLIKSANSKDAINKIYLDWLDSLGKVKTNKHRVDTSIVFTKNLDLTWLNDSIIFSKDLISKLNYIKDNRSKRHYYFKTLFTSKPFKHEKIYNDSLFPSEGLRLIGLFRYWNIINYFYPNKYLIDENWNTVLEEMIPVFINSKDTIDYNIAMLLLTSKINDSHAFFNTQYTAKYLGYYYPAFKCKIIDNKAIVTDFWNDPLAKENDILYGDVIFKLNNIALEDVIKARIKYVGASNEPTKLQRLSPLLFKSEIDSCMITFERNGQIFNKAIRLYRFGSFHYKWGLNNDKVCKELDDTIGYINMGVLKRKQVDSVMKIMMDKKAIIFDVRNYPNKTGRKIAKYLNKDKIAFSKFTSPDLSYPGIFKWTQINSCGKKKNDNYYKGKVVLLFNEETQSQAEYTCMAFQTAPDVKCIGSQTAGADGNVSNIIFPGGYKTCMTGLGVYYPNGKETQRIGIVPDIEVKPTIEGIKNKKDEVLERAIKYINTGN